MVGRMSNTRSLPVALWPDRELPTQEIEHLVILALTVYGERSGATCGEKRDRRELGPSGDAGVRLFQILREREARRLIGRWWRDDRGCGVFAGVSYLAYRAAFYQPSRTVVDRAVARVIDAMLSGPADEWPDEPPWDWYGRICKRVRGELHAPGACVVALAR
jgi:hypothetical protein